MSNFGRINVQDLPVVRSPRQYEHLLGIDDASGFCRVRPRDMTPPPIIVPANKFSALMAREFPYPIYESGDGRIITGFNPEFLLPQIANFDGAVYWMDVATGANADNGSTQALAKQSMSSVITAANSGNVATIVMVKSGVYIRSHSWNGGTRFTVPYLAVIGYGGPVIFGLHDNATWGVDGTFGNCYSTTTFTTAARIVDTANFDDRGDYQEFTEVATPTECNTRAFDSGPGFWSVDGSKVYVRRKDAAVVSNTNTRVYRPSVEGARCSTSAGAITLVVNIQFEGGNNGNFIGDSNATGKCYLLNCVGKWVGRNGASTDAFKARDIAFMFFYRCQVAHSTSDGFDYTPAAGTIPTGILIECHGYRNGGLDSVSDNGLTAHNGCTIIDICGLYEENEGADVAFTSTDPEPFTEAWCIGTQARNSRGDLMKGGTNDPQEFACYSRCNLYLDRCITDGSVYELFTNATSTIYHRNHTFGRGAIRGNITETV